MNGTDHEIAKTVRDWFYKQACANEEILRTACRRSRGLKNKIKCNKNSYLKIKSYLGFCLFLYTRKFMI